MRKSMLIINTPDNCYSCRFREFNKDMLNDKNGGEYEALQDSSALSIIKN